MTPAPSLSDLYRAYVRVIWMIDAHYTARLAKPSNDNTDWVA